MKPTAMRQAVLHRPVPRSSDLIIHYTLINGAAFICTLYIKKSYSLSMELFSAAAICSSISAESSGLSLMSFFTASRP